MKRKRLGIMTIIAAIALTLFAPAFVADAKISTLMGSEFNMTARTGTIYTGEGFTIHVWGYTTGPKMQYPGPTLELMVGMPVTIHFTNNLPVATSIVFPGMDVTASGGTPGLLTNEAAPGGVDEVTYTFTPTRPGTFIYYSGTDMDLQIEMGLVGAIIVRPMGYNHMMPETWRAYNHEDSSYDHEYLILETEMDHRVHFYVQLGQYNTARAVDYYPVYWFINGRNAPDTMLDDFHPLFPTQPYGAMVMMHPGDNVLIRIINAGRDLHPFHAHGNNFEIIARDAVLLESVPGVSGADLKVSDFTTSVSPGGTEDFIFHWTGHGLGWDMYGHSPEDPMEMGEDPNDHGKPFPVIIPEQQDLTFGDMYSGSPFLGVAGDLPPGHPGLNEAAGFFYMWHSHNEKEMVNNDIFPGGLMTMLLVLPHGVPIEH